MDFRTDLALESGCFARGQKQSGKMGQKEEELPSGIRMEQEEPAFGLRVTRIVLETEEGAKKLGKPKGNYITLELPLSWEKLPALKQQAAEVLAKELGKLIPFRKGLRVLVIGLGNPQVTPDSLGPRTVDQVHVTRHIFLLTGRRQDRDLAAVSALAPGVMAATGMETAELIRKAAELVNPHAVLAVDALAARDPKRITTTIQLCDTGIAPGAGTGNMRKELNRKTLGVPVVAIGVPTVIDSKTLVFDALGEFIGDEQAALEKLEQAEDSLMVTVTDIDRTVQDFAEIIGRAINIALCPGIYSS